ncbi:MAG TPA: PAS domain S-box protein, partial [Candidatus Synoicihabitans sp.]|nr:PAS domain S-box protein [Candidatus Synoicihabitans sp.]
MLHWLNQATGAISWLPVGAAMDPSWARLHVGFDLATGALLLLLPLVLAYLVVRRRDLLQPRLFVVFGVLLVGLAAQRLVGAYAPSHPDFWASAWLEVFIAGVALTTLIMLLRLVPTVLRLPGRDDLRRLNDELDERVRSRTTELTAANDRLAGEIRHREEAEAEVRRLNASLENRISELQTLFEFIPIGVGIAKDVQCSFIQMNPALAIILNLPRSSNASLSGHSPAPAARYRAFHRDVELEPHQHPMQVAAAENQPVLDFEMTVMRSDGIVLDVLVSAVPLRDRTGHARGCVATFQDITQRKRSERERLEFERRLQETQKLESLGVLSGGIAHDFNNLLTGVLGHSNLARFALQPGQDSVVQALDQIERSAQRAAELCKQLLAYAGKG